MRKRARVADEGGCGVALLVVAMVDGGDVVGAGGDGDQEDLLRCLFGDTVGRRLMISRMDTLALQSFPNIRPGSDTYEATDASCRVWFTEVRWKYLH